VLARDKVPRGVTAFKQFSPMIFTHFPSTRLSPKLPNR